MASARKSENQGRIAAINNARDAILERAENDSSRMMAGLLANPQLTFALGSFDKVVEILLKKGFKNELVTLSKHFDTPRLQKSQLRIKLLEAGFEDVCAGEVAVDSSTPFSSARLIAEAAFANLCSVENHAAC
jgi:hypothetical protein